MSRIITLSLVAVASLASCKPSAAEIQQEFAEVVAESNACTDVDDCVAVSPGCPLGCLVAVNREQEAAVKAEAAELIESYSSPNVSCNNFCGQPGTLVCKAGRCALESSP